MKHTAHSLIMLTASPNCLPNLRLCLAYTYKNTQAGFFHAFICIWGKKFFDFNCCFLKRISLWIYTFKDMHRFWFRRGLIVSPDYKIWKKLIL